MGKSPGKWLKSVLFGKKSFRSTKRKDSLKSSNEKGLNNTNKGKEVLISENSPVISEPVLINTYGTSILPSIEDSKSSKLDSIKPENTNPINASNINELRENEAATKAQAAFRGFLARRAFRALKGIIRLQGLVRGFLVRRQAVSTLYAMNGIIKFQALARGRITRRSNSEINVDFSKIYKENENLRGCEESVNAWKENFSKNSLGYKLLASEISSKSLKLQYEETNPNSVLNWLERWERTQFWNPISKSKISIKSKSKLKKTNSPNQTQNLKSKKRQISQKNPEQEKLTKTTRNSSSEKPKTNSRRFSLSPSSLSSSKENPKTKPQNPKKPLKKTSNSLSEADFKKTKNKETSPIILPSKTVLQKSISPSEISLSSTNGDSISKPQKSVNKSSVNNNNNLASKTVQPEENSSTNGDSIIINKLHKRRSSISSALKTVPSEENLSSKLHSRRSSFSAGLEIQETESQSGSLKSVPSYMASTQSAKARVKGSQVSPRVGNSIPDSSEGGKIGILRRHSLPSLGGKLKPDSPRNRNPGFGSGSKGLVKGERSVTMSREGTGSEKLIQAEWKR